MATQAVIKPQYEIDTEKCILEIFQTTLEVPSVGVGHIASCIHDRNKVSLDIDAYFDAEDLEEIAAGQFLEDHRDGYGDGNYLGSLLIAVEWWTDIANAITMGDGILTVKVPGYKERGENLVDMLSKVLGAYPAAVADSFGLRDFSNDASSPHVELLRRYRQFTRSVCKAAQEVWPEFDFRPLRRQV